MRLSQPSKQRGFSLLEAMLAIVVLTALVIVGISAYQIKARHNKVDKAVFQSQQWLQAAYAFYYKHTKWPDPNDPDLFKNFIQVYKLSVKNPWGNPYRIALEDNTDAATSQFLNLMIKTAASDPPNTAAIAQQLNSYFNDTSSNHPIIDNTVTVQVIKPPLVNNFDPKKFVTIKFIKDHVPVNGYDDAPSKPIDPPTDNECPPGTKGYVFVAAQQFGCMRDGRGCKNNQKDILQFDTDYDDKTTHKITGRIDYEGTGNNKSNQVKSLVIGVCMVEPGPASGGSNTAVNSPTQHTYLF